jgi:glycolate oxidase
MDTASELRKILPGKIITERERKIPYTADASYFTGSEPVAVAIPETVEEVSQIVTFCYENRVNIVPRGGGTSLTGSSVPGDNSVVLSLSKFNKILEIRPENMYVVVEPGVRLDDLNNTLRKFGYFYPPDPASSVAATVGGSISTNAGGLRASTYGTTRNWVLGLEVVLPDGSIISTGGKTLKVSAGYDLTALFVGAEGTLGVVTKAILKIWPLPEAIGRILTYYDSIEKVGLAISKMKELGMIPLIAEFLDSITMDSLERTRAIEFPKEAGFCLIIDVSSTNESIQRIIERARSILVSFHPVSITVTTDPEEMQKIYEARKGAYSSLLNERNSESERVVIGDIVVPASELPATLIEAEKQIKEHGLKVALFGHIADGNIHMNIYADLGSKEQMAAVESFQQAMGMVAVRHGGSVSAEHGIGIEKKGLLAMEMKETNNVAELKLMKDIKKLVDPNNIMNGGKIFDI